MDKLTGYIKKLGPCAVAFSGGVDSSVVAAAAFAAHGEKSLAVTVISELVSQSEADEAAHVARHIGIRHETIRVNVFENEAVAQNSPERCYHCKKEAFSRIIALAKAYGLNAVLDGTNADDTKGYRPGIRALKEMGVISPLMELGIGKEAVRAMAREMGLPNHNRPSAPCAASRFPYGTPFTPEGIARVMAAEGFIKSLGFRVLRVRDHGTLARIEVEKEMIPLLVSDEVREKVVAKLVSLGYNYVSVDMAGFVSGSMDIGLETKPDIQGKICR